MYRLIIILLLVCCNKGFLNAKDAAMPIIAYMGVPDWKTSDDNFKVLSECGFTVSLYPYSSVDLLVKACRCANKYGVKVLGQTKAMYSDPVTVAQKLKNEPGFYGYFLYDEPDAPKIKEMQNVITKIKKVDNSHKFYINLLAFTNPDWVKGNTKLSSYPDYIKTLTATGCQQISFDHYPITKSGLKPNWYHNLEMIRKESLRSGKPFWGFTLCVPHTTPYSDYPAPTMASLRLQIYSNLAYGAQAIEYFTYWTPGQSEGFGYHDAPVSYEGKKTKTYALVQSMNKELKKIATLFYGAKVLRVNHIGKKTPNGTTQMTVLPTNIASLKVISNKGALVSEMEKNGHLYLCVVNKDYKNSMTLNISSKNQTPVQVSKNLVTQTMKSTYKISAGDMVLFRLN